MTKGLRNNTHQVIPIQLGIVKSFLIKGDKTVIVDTGYPGYSEQILDHLRKNSIAPSDVSLIIITHGHIDHYGSADELRKLTAAPVAMHRADAKHIREGTHYIGMPTCLAARIFKALFIKTDPMQTKSLEADIVFETDIDLKDFGVVGRIIHTPGHTAGSVSVILPDGSAIIGDLLMGGLVRRKTPHSPLFARNLRQTKESMRKILGLSTKIIHPSHGGPFTREAVEMLIGKMVRK